MRRRIVMLAAGTALLAVVLLSIPLGLLARRGYLRDERLELQQAAASAAARARGDVTSSGLHGVSLPVDSSEVQVSVYDPAGRRVAGPGPVTAPGTVQAALAGQEASVTAGQEIRVAAPVSDGDQVVAALLLSTNLEAVNQRTARAWLLLAGMDSAAVLVAAAAAMLVARRLARPLDELAVVAGKVGAGDLAARVRPSGVTEIDTLATTLNDTVQRVQTMIGRERALSTEVSHQLRTPLSGLRLELEAAQAELRGDAERAACEGDEATEGAGPAVRRALAAVHRLEGTITDVIALARDLPAASEVEVSALLGAASARWHGPLAAASRPLRCVADPGAPARLGISRAAATQILDVLLDNAYRHGRGAVSVRVGRVSRGLALVEVADEGPFLALEPWQLFGRRDDHSLHGLGLPYARRLAEAEGARLTLRRADPPTFGLTAPAAAPT